MHVANILENGDETRAVVAEVIRRVLPSLAATAVEQAVRDTLQNPQERARLALRLEGQRVREASISDAAAITEAYATAASMIARSQPRISAGDMTGWAAYPEYRATGLPAPLDWLPSPPGAWRR